MLFAYSISLGFYYTLHKKFKFTCKICEPEKSFLSLQRSSLHSMLKKGNHKKWKHTHEFLGCTREYFYNFIQLVKAELELIQFYCNFGITSALLQSVLTDLVKDRRNILIILFSWLKPNWNRSSSGKNLFIEKRRLS